MFIKNYHMQSYLSHQTWANGVEKEFGLCATQEWNWLDQTLQPRQPMLLRESHVKPRTGKNLLFEQDNSAAKG